MGLLSEGEALSWEETKLYADHVRYHGVTQFINLYHRLKDRSNDCLRWGDEVEYTLVKLDHEQKRARLLLKAETVLEALQKEQQTSPNDHPTTWHPEYGSYMVEGTPGKPYGHRMAHFNTVEANMKIRRMEVLNQLSTDEVPLSLTSFPSLGCPGFTEPQFEPRPLHGVSRSLFLPDEMIFNGHPRFKTLTRNIRQRRGAKVAINIPIFHDTNTPKPFVEDLKTPGEATDSGAALVDHVYMDAMGFGMGACSLQMTFQACNICEARHLYDQLAPLCPILLALSAACPIQRGFLVDNDCRWNIIAASVDDRTKEERGLEPLKNNQFQINKSRYDSIDSYLSPCSEKFNDIELVYDKAIYDRLREADIDHLLAQHIAHLFIRDSISLFRERIHQDDESESDHFENIQSTNWQTMRFKPPPPNSSIGWRVEFRPTEVQLTDFENAAYAVFIVLLTRVILSFNLMFVIPISKVDENLKVAQKRDAVLNEKFYFRKNISTGSTPRQCAEQICCSKVQECECGLLTVNEIVNGKPGEFPGLLPLIYLYLDSVDDCDIDTSCTITQYLNLIKMRASGEVKTTARWMRDFVHAHPDYKHDSRVSDLVTYDLVCECAALTSGEKHDPQLVPVHDSKTNSSIPSALKRAEHVINSYRQRDKETIST